MGEITVKYKSFTITVSSEGVGKTPQQPCKTTFIVAKVFDVTWKVTQEIGHVEATGEGYAFEWFDREATTNRVAAVFDADGYVFVEGIGDASEWSPLAIARSSAIKAVVAVAGACAHGENWWLGGLGHGYGNRGNCIKRAAFELSAIRVNSAVIIINF